jgi:hypothetical protein
MDSNRITVDGRWEKFKAFDGEDDGERSFVLLYIEKKLEGNKKKTGKTPEIYRIMQLDRRNRFSFALYVSSKGKASGLFL